MTVSIQKIREDFIALKEVQPEGDEYGMLELIGTSFIADEPAIFGEPNEAYIQSELDWYRSQSRDVNDIKPFVPKIWRDVASPEGFINSNYGWLMFNEGNGDQYRNVRRLLRQLPGTRRAVAIYTRPSMHKDATTAGMNDFICTNAVNYFIRDEMLHAVVQMRSNDVVYGYRNDWAWQQYVLEKLAEDLEVDIGHIVWQAASLHVYPRHLDLVK